jgi:cyclic pyranopterin phosphate synthase
MSERFAPVTPALPHEAPAATSSPPSSEQAARPIPLVDLRHVTPKNPLPTTQPTVLPNGQLQDPLRRPLRDLRISVTDRCNFRCSYCMPKEVFDKDYAYLPHQSLLSFEEITRLARLFLAHGVQKIRLTGGEPLLRKNIEVLIAQLAELRTLEGRPPEIALTTNGSLLARKAAGLKAAGLNRVTISLDGLDDAVFRQMNDVDFPVADVLAGIQAAQDAGLGEKLKVNMVVKRGTNDHQILPMARHFRGSGVQLRFIEYMDVGSTNGWRMNEVLPSREVIARLQTAFPLVPLEAHSPGETAQRWGYANEQGAFNPQLGEVGVISSVTQAFCGDCNRARLTTEGQLYLCLFANQGHDLRGLLRAGANDTEVASAIAHIWQGRKDRYSQIRHEMRASSPAESDQPTAEKRRVEMSYIGG